MILETDELHQKKIPSVRRDFNVWLLGLVFYKLNEFASAIVISDFYQIQSF